MFHLKTSGSWHKFTQKLLQNLLKGRFHITLFSQENVEVPSHFTHCTKTNKSHFMSVFPLIKILLNSVKLINVLNQEPESQLQNSTEYYISNTESNNNNNNNNNNNVLLIITVNNECQKWNVWMYSNWSHQNNNENFKEKFGSHTVKTLNKFTITIAMYLERHTWHGI